MSQRRRRRRSEEEAEASRCAHLSSSSTNGQLSSAKMLVTSLEGKRRAGPGVGPPTDRRPRNSGPAKRRRKRTFARPFFLFFYIVAINQSISIFSSSWPRSFFLSFFLSFSQNPKTCFISLSEFSSPLAPLYYFANDFSSSSSYSLHFLLLLLLLLLLLNRSSSIPCRPLFSPIQFTKGKKENREAKDERTTFQSQLRTTKRQSYELGIVGILFPAAILLLFKLPHVLCVAVACHSDPNARPPARSQTRYHFLSDCRDSANRWLVVDSTVSLFVTRRRRSSTGR